MKTVFQNGHTNDIPYFIQENDIFYIQDIGKDTPDRYVYPNDQLKYVIDASLVSLYDTFRDLLFSNTDEYYTELDLLPVFVQTAGQDSNCGVSAELFQELISSEEMKNVPNFFKHLYLVDCQFLIGTIQNLLIGMEYCFINYYLLLSSSGSLIDRSNSDGIYTEVSGITMSISTLLESYFTKAYSILDILCKIVFELNNPLQELTSYRKLRSSSIMWGDRKNLSINGSTGTVFKSCDLIRTIESIRNEIVHNGTWELHPKIFLKQKDGKIIDRFMLFPDISQGRLSTVKNRKHFFSDKVKVNDILPSIHFEYRSRLLRTIEMMQDHKINQRIL